MIFISKRKNKGRVCELFLESVTGNGNIRNRNCGCAWCNACIACDDGNEVANKDFQVFRYYIKILVLQLKEEKDRIENELNHQKEENEKLKAENNQYAEAFAIKDNDKYIFNMMKESADYYQAMLSLEDKVKELEAENEELKVKKATVLEKYFQRNGQYIGLIGERDSLKAENTQLKAQLQNCTYTCAYCKKTFLKGQTDEAALKELERDFGVDKKDCELICDNCYQNRDKASQVETEKLIKFRLGDRVAVHRDGRDTFRGTIFNIVNGKLSVIEDGFYSAHDDSPFLPSQCKRLTRKRKRHKVSQVEHCEHSGVELAIQKPICECCKGAGRLGGSFVTLGGRFVERDIKCPRCCGNGIVRDAQ